MPTKKLHGFIHPAIVITVILLIIAGLFLTKTLKHAGTSNKTSDNSFLNILNQKIPPIQRIFVGNDVALSRTAMGHWLGTRDDRGAILLYDGKEVFRESVDEQNKIQLNRLGDFFLSENGEHYIYTVNNPNPNKHDELFVDSKKVFDAPCIGPIQVTNQGSYYFVQCNNQGGDYKLMKGSEEVLSSNTPIGDLNISANGKDYLISVVDSDSPAGAIPPYIKSTLYLNGKRLSSGNIDWAGLSPDGQHYWYRTTKSAPPNEHGVPNILSQTLYIDGSEANMNKKSMIPFQGITNSGKYIMDVEENDGAHWWYVDGKSYAKSDRGGADNNNYSFNIYMNDDGSEILEEFAHVKYTLNGKTVDLGETTLSRVGQARLEGNKIYIYEH